MNMFVLLKTLNGMELVTPPLSSGVILPGVTRRCVLVSRYYSLISNGSISPQLRVFRICAPYGRT